MNDKATDQAKVDTLQVPGAVLYHEIRGSGPVLLMIPGGPTDADVFAPIVPLLADRYTVVTYDTRGNSRSHLDGPVEGGLLDAHVDDAHRLLAAVGSEPAYVLGSSSGAILGLELAARHPEQVRTLVAHEPPVTELLDDREEHRARTRKILDTYRREGVGPAMAVFTAGAGLEGEAPPPPPSDPPPEMLAGMARMQANMEFFLGELLPALDGYVPDTATLRSGPSRIVVAIGDTAEGQLAHRSAVAVARSLGIEPVVFPGGHGGFLSAPAEFVDQLDKEFHATP